MGFFFLVVCVAFLTSASAQSVLNECVNETLVLNVTCRARPQHSNFFKLLEDLIKRDTALVVVELTIPDVDPILQNHYRFDLVKTDLGQTLLTLKSQMEFLTINLPLLSERVDRQAMELITSPPGCLTNLTITDTVVKNWLLCGLTRKKDKIEHLLVKKVCFAKPYEEPNDWFLFRDTYYHECTETTIKDSEWITLDEDDLVKLSKKILNYGVTIVTIFCVIIFTIYRRLFHTRARVFLCKLQEPKTRIYEIVKKTSCDSDEVKLFPNKINFPAFKFERRKIVCSGNRPSNPWKEISSENRKYQLNITGFWFDIKRNALISQNSFGILTLVQAAVEEVINTVCKMFKHRCCKPKRLRKYLHLLLHILLILIVSTGVLLPVFLFYKCDPFHTLLDGLVSLLIFIIVPVSMIVTKATLGFCRHEIVYSVQRIILEVAFFVLAFFVVAILSRVIVVLLVGFAFKSGSDIYTLVSSTVFFVLLNGYKQLQKTHKKYQEYLNKCMTHITQLVDESDTQNKPVFKSRIVPSCQRVDIWPERKGMRLSLTLNGFVLFYLPNGESAINRDVFLRLCRNDSSNSPGDLRWTFLMDILKFIFWGIVVSGILYVQHVVAKNFDSSLYSQAPSAVLGGLIPYVFDSVLFPDHPKEENTNLTRLLNNTATELKKQYLVVDFEMNGQPTVCNTDQELNDWKKICIERSCCSCCTCCTGCCCFQEEVEDQSNDRQPTSKDDDEEAEGHSEEKAEEGRAKPKRNIEHIKPLRGGLKNPTFKNDDDNRV